MADKKGYKKKTVVQEFGKEGGFGEYEETNGGGTPKGGIWGGQDGRVGWDERVSKGESGHREKQARTADGKFTYNSVNGKELSPNSDPTRGKTVNPLLTGGKNGVYIDDSTYSHDVKSSKGDGTIIHKAGEKIAASGHNVKKDFENKSGSYWDDFRGKWHQAGGEAIVGGKVKINANAIVDYAKAGKYVGKDFVFEYNGKLETEMWESKSGAHSKEEKAALAKGGNKEHYVKDKDDAIAVAKKYKPKAKEEPKEELPPETKPEPTKPEVKEEVKEEVAEAIPNELPKNEPKDEPKAEPWGKSGKFTTADRDEMIGFVKAQMEKMGDAWDPDFFTDDDIEELLLEKEKENK